MHTGQPDIHSYTNSHNNVTTICTIIISTGQSFCTLDADRQYVVKITSLIKCIAQYRTSFIIMAGFSVKRECAV